MSKKYYIEKLMIDDSFINYSFGSNKSDIDKWEQFLKENPQDREMIFEAKGMVISLNKMLLENQKELDPFGSKMEINKPETESRMFAVSKGSSGKYRKFRKVFYAAASLIIMVGLTMFWISLDKKKNNLSHTNNAAYSDLQTAVSEKKVVWLPDSTKVILNSKSQLTVAKDFGQINRVVTLSGEAFFEVTHDKEKPFIVQMPAYEVRVLGTSFNVKAYPEDAVSETSLVKGSIEIVLKNDRDRKFLLKPNEKAILSNSNNEEIINQPVEKTTTLDNPVKFSIKNVRMAPGKQDIVETAWTKNRLEIIDESFEQIKPILERWYGVTIHFKDNEVKSYQYTATFEDESIEQVLDALSLSLKYKYKIDNKDIYISSISK